LESKKIIAAAVVALFCVTAFACIVGDDSDAASKNYELYVEILDDEHIVSDFVYVYFESEADNEKYCEAATAAFAAAGYSDITLEVGNYGVSVKYKGSGNNSCWYSNGMSWVTVSSGSEDYINHVKAGVAVNNGWIGDEEYEELPEYEKVNWQEDQYMPGYYQKILEAPGAAGAIKEYTSYLTVIDDDLVTFKTTSISFKAEDNISAWIYGFNAATKALGNSIFAKVKVTYAMGYVSVSYGDSGNTACWVKEGKNWVSVTEPAKEYAAASETDFELQNGWISEEQYNGLEKGQQAFWVEDSMMKGWYQRIATGEIVEEVADLLVIGVIAAIIIIAIIIVLIVVFVKKKKTTA